MVQDSTTVPEAPLEPAAPQRRPTARLVIAVLAVAAIVAAGVGVAVHGRSSSSAAHLPRLELTGTPLASATTANARAAVGALPQPALRPFFAHHYVHHGAWPAIADHANVWRLDAPSLDAATVTRLAAAFGIRAVPSHDGSTWTVHDGDETVEVETAGVTTSVTVYRSGASGGVAGGSAGSSTASNAPVLVAPGPPTTVPAPGATITAPADLPSAADAERIARDLLDRAGVLDSKVRWDVSASDSGVVGFAASCPANADCAQPPTSSAVVTSRAVTFHPRLDGVVVDGLQWSVEIGDRGAVLGASGPLGTFAVLGSYPLRAVDRAFADLNAAQAGWPGWPMPIPMGVVSPAGTPPAVAVDIDDVTLAWAVLSGRADGHDGMFVVPAYRFSGHDASEPSVTADEPALDPSFVTTPPVVPTTNGIKGGVPTPQPAPARDAAPPPPPDSTAAAIVPRPLTTVPAHTPTP
jgi:hypothetical protein